MSYKHSRIAEVAEVLLARLNETDDKKSVLRAIELKALYDELKLLPAEQRAAFGKEVNALKQELEAAIAAAEDQEEDLTPIDVTAPFDVNVPLDQKPQLLSSEVGSRHPVMTELDSMLDIFYRMGFEALEARQIDDDFHMFGSLNFPEGHPARDDYDTLVTTEGLIAPAHTSTMQHRVLKQHQTTLEQGEPIAVVVPGRVFRNEDLDARHEHTFYQLEGVYVGENITVGHLMSTLQTFMQEYYHTEIELKTQPFYFPFTEPSFEFAISCPFCNKQGCHVCGEGWIELLGCGMIHPNVLQAAGVDPQKYTGFAWGIGFMRMVMIKYNIEDIRHFQAGKLDFLRQFR